MEQRIGFAYHMQQRCILLYTEYVSTLVEGLAGCAQVRPFIRRLLFTDRYHCAVVMTFVLATWEGESSLPVHAKVRRSQRRRQPGTWDLPGTEVGVQ